MTAARPQRHRPIPRRRTALAGVVAFAALLTGMLALVGMLRHPFPDEDVTLPAAVDDDPRTEIVCPDEQPLEGREREEPQVGPAQAPVEVGSSDLYDCPATWHDRRVRYRGEAVGALLRRSTGAWVQLNDDVYAGAAGPLPAHRSYRGGNAGVGVLIPLDLAEQIEHVGGPREHGDSIEVVGTFRRIDPVHREVAVIVADSGEVLARGSAIANPLLADRALAAALLALLAAVLVTAERIASWRR